MQYCRAFENNIIPVCLFISMKKTTDPTEKLIRGEEGALVAPKELSKYISTLYVHLMYIPPIISNSRGIFF